MTLPNLSSSMVVGRLRYIQSIHESCERCNHDTLVRRFIPIRERLRAAWLSREYLAKLRTDPFYIILSRGQGITTRCFGVAGRQVCPMVPAAVQVVRRARL